MDAVRVSGEGLQTLAERYSAASGEVAADGRKVAVGPSGQATSAAVTSGHAAVDAAAGALASRVEWTASKRRVSGATYTAQDEDSAQRIAAASRSTEA